MNCAACQAYMKDCDYTRLYCNRTCRRKGRGGKRNRRLLKRAGRKR